MTEGTIRCSSRTIAGLAILLSLGAATAFAGVGSHTTGFNMSKTCPTVAASGSNFNCIVTLSNRDDQHGVINLTVTNAYPIGGTAAAVDCRQPFDPTDCTAGSVVTTLGTAGSPTEACGACLPETAPINCTATNQNLTDEVVATGTDAAPAGSAFFNLPVSSSTTNATPIAPLLCGDNNSCTTDSCDTTTGCTHTPISCGDDNACTTDSCDATNGCTHSAISCDDSNACTDDSCDATNGCVHADNGTCNEAVGRMTGGGSVFTEAGGRVTHGFELHCDVEVGPNNLEINWGPGNQFHLEELLSASCSDDPNIAPPPPAAGFDTYVGTGTGRCNGVAGAAISFTLTDAGEPGKLDTAAFEITGCPGGLTLSVSGSLKKGNHQAHAN
jgi:hypothetical protein